MFKIYIYPNINKYVYNSQQIFNMSQIYMYFTSVRFFLIMNFSDGGHFNYNIDSH